MIPHWLLWDPPAVVPPVTAADLDYAHVRDADLDFAHVRSAELEV